jgi:hypothetical protein
MAGITTLPQLRESPETAKLQGVLVADGCAVVLVWAAARQQASEKQKNE